MDEKVESYRVLCERFGPGRLADALLAKWLADPEADGSWLMLDACVRHAGTVWLRDGVPTRVREHSRLTERELDVLHLYARGLHGPAVASRLALSPHTVRRVLDSAAQRLGTRTVTAAVAAAIRSGQLDPG